jgi:hypothetical protein
MKFYKNPTDLPELPISPIQQAQISEYGDVSEDQAYGYSK